MVVKDKGRRLAGIDFWLAVIGIAGGLTVAGASMMRMMETTDTLHGEAPARFLHAQASPPAREAPDQTPSPGQAPPDSQSPARPDNDKARPMTPPPEPARPDDDARKAGAKPVLPPAPAEKTAPPINAK